MKEDRLAGISSRPGSARTAGVRGGRTDPTRRGRPDGVDTWQIFLFVGDAAPVGINHCRLVGQTSKMSFTINFDAAGARRSAAAAFACRAAFPAVGARRSNAVREPAAAAGSYNGADPPPPATRYPFGAPRPPSYLLITCRGQVVSRREESRVSFEAEKLTALLKRSAGAAVAALRAAAPGETFYAFALYTDDDAAGVSLAANSQEALARAIARHNFADDRENVGLRWSTGEWAYEGFGPEHFKDFDAALEASKPDSEKQLESHRRRVQDLMVNALAALDADGVFGRGPERDRVTLLCAITDADRSGEAFAERSINTLNPPAVRAAYEASLKKLTEPKADKGPPCPKCGKPLRTAKAQQCFVCGAKWHGQSAAGTR